jgi:hypothetical protein
MSKILDKKKEPAKEAPAKPPKPVKPSAPSVVKPAAPVKHENSRPIKVEGKPVKTDLPLKKLPGKVSEAPPPRPTRNDLKPVGKNLHWLADSRARDVLRVANDMPWVLDKGDKRQGSIRNTLNALLAYDLDLEEDDLREIMTLRSKRRGLIRQIGNNDETPEMPDPDDTVAMNLFYREWAEILNPDSEGNPEERFRQWILEIRPDLAQLENTADVIDQVIEDALRDGIGLGPAIAINAFLNEFNDAKRYPDLVMVDVDNGSNADSILSQLPDSALIGNRPVVVLMHGVGEGFLDFTEAYREFYRNYDQDWLALPLEQRPIIIGMRWQSTDQAF